MNNRYTYKAKRKDNGEWVYGYYGKFTIGSFIITDFANCAEIILATLCQCTGLQDIEGNYIFENDIFDVFDKNGNITETLTIIWNDKEASYEVVKLNGNHCSFDARCWLKGCKVIRNKFDEMVE